MKERILTMTMKREMKSSNNWGRKLFRLSANIKESTRSKTDRNIVKEESHDNKCRKSGQEI
jgi:hypothetical protein